MNILKASDVKTLNPNIKNAKVGITHKMKDFGNKNMYWANFEYEVRNLNLKDTTKVYTKSKSVFGYDLQDLKTKIDSFFGKIQKDETLVLV